MKTTPYPEVNAILAVLLERTLLILDTKLVGLYLYGSLVSGDFDYSISDIDLLAVLSFDLSEQEFNGLHTLHERIATEYPAWKGRIEIAYLSVNGLKTYRTQESLIAVISPGEPFHFKEAGKDWLINWWVIRHDGVTLYGPPASQIIDPISQAEFLQTVQEHALGWREWVREAQNLPGQAYAILTLCRALYACCNGEQVSKKRAATWVQEQFPAWSDLIQSAFTWRSDPAKYEQVDAEAVLPQTNRFVQFIIDQILPGA